MNIRQKGSERKMARLTIIMLTCNLLQFTRCSQTDIQAWCHKIIVDQIMIAVVCKLHFSNMRACISAHFLLHFQGFLCCRQNLLYMGHTQVSQFLLTCCHKASETTAP